MSTPAAPLRIRRYALWLALLLALKLGAQCWLYADGFYGVSADAQGRTVTAMRWAQEPHLAIHGVWLPLDQYLFGAALLVWSDPVWTPRFVTLALGLASMALAAAAARRLFCDDLAALLTAAAVGSLPWHLWTSGSALSEQLLLVPALGLALATLRAGRAGRVGALILAALCCSACAMVRYEAWLYVPVFGAGLLILAWRAPQRRLVCLPLAVLPALYPLLWIMGNHWQYGEWFSFLRVTAQPFAEVTRTPAAYRVAVELPLRWISHSPFLVLLQVAGLLHALRWAWRDTWLFYLWVPLTHLVATVAAELLGASASHTPERLFLLPVVMLMPFGARLVSLAWQRRAGAGAFAAVPLLAVYLMALALGHVQARQPPITPFHPDNIALGRALGAWFDAHPRGNVLMERPLDLGYWWGPPGVMVHSGHPGRILVDKQTREPALSHLEARPDQLRAWLAGHDVVIVAVVGATHEQTLLAMGARPMATVARWRLMDLSHAREGAEHDGPAGD